jgi:hypothetical protein
MIKLFNVIYICSKPVCVVPEYLFYLMLLSDSYYYLYCAHSRKVCGDTIS